MGIAGSMSAGSMGFLNEGSWIKHLLSEASLL